MEWTETRNLVNRPVKDYLMNSVNWLHPIRDITLAAVAVIALPLAIWSGTVAYRQAETAQRGLLHERYHKGAEMLGSELLSVRLGGIYALQRLAEDHPGQYHIQIMRLLCAFVRHPTTDASAQAKSSPGRKYPRLREDVQAVMKAIGGRSQAGFDYEKTKGSFRLDLQNAYLLGANLYGANLSGANLHGVNLEAADLLAANLSGVDLTLANLHRVNLNSANLNGANLGGANLSRVLAQHADLSSVDLGGANLSHAHLEWADLSSANVSTADLSHAWLQGTNLSGAAFGKAIRRTLSDPPISEVVFARLTQTQLDEAKADPDNPPKIDPVVVDAETGKPLVWRGKPLEKEKQSRRIVDLPEDCYQREAEVDVRPSYAGCCGTLLHLDYTAEVERSHEDTSRH